MKVTLLEYPENATRLVAAAAKLCYAASDIDTLMDGLDDEKSEKFVEMLGGLGHDSPIEHASFTFGIEGVSRSLLAQITRHRIASFSVQSQRYVRLDDFRFVTPPAIEAIPEAREKYLAAMEADAKAYEELTELLKNRYIAENLACGDDEKSAARKAEKKAIEDARFVLPNACETRMLLTMNARSLHNFFRLRCCNRAQWEIKAVADEMLRLVYGVAPALFRDSGPACVCGACSEGKMSCGRAEEMREYYRRLKAGE